MIYNDFAGDRLSALGFGLMRLPTLENGEIDTLRTEAMVDYALAHGLNYFDTAWPYHACKSELVIGEILQKYPRNSFYLADKFPGHCLSESYDAKAVFEKQLQKCRVDYFDYYLLHNVYEGSFDVYTDPKWSITEYFIEQKKAGRIRHLGMSTHGKPEVIARFLDRYPEIEFVQIQLNYLDWTLQNAEATVKLLRERGKAIWVMEGLRGGKLARWTEAEERLLQETTGEKISAVEAAFRWLLAQEGVTVILSGMSSLEQMEQNIAIFGKPKALTPELNQFLMTVAEGKKNSVPCTACRYCTAVCPQGLDIPRLLQSYNDMSFEKSITPVMWIENLPKEKKPSACLKCGQCSAMCPQKIAIPEVLQKLCGQIDSIPTWAEISRVRSEDAKRLG